MSNEQTYPVISPLSSGGSYRTQLQAAFAFAACTVGIACIFTPATDEAALEEIMPSEKSAASQSYVCSASRLRAKRLLEKVHIRFEPVVQYG